MTSFAVLLVPRRVHAAAQDIGGFHQEGFELRKGDLVGRHVISVKLD